MTGRLLSHLMLVAFAATAHAQVREIGDGGRPLIIQAPATDRSGRVAAALDAAHVVRLHVALRLRDQGLLRASRDSLARLLSEVPHHPLILTELARVELDQSNWTTVRRLAIEERAFQKDSVLLGRELCEAYERLGQPTDAAKIAIEAWAASPLESEWALQTVLRLTPADPRAVREALRRAALAAPVRTDLARGLARLEWRGGDAKAMVRALAGADHAGSRVPQRWTFAEELVRSGVTRDTTGAIEALLDMAADRSLAAGVRASTARRAWDLATFATTPRDLAPRLAAALHDIPTREWDAGLRLDLARHLRESGRTAEARALLSDTGGPAASDPGLELERALADLRDGPPDRALPALRATAERSDEGAFRYAEALFFAGEMDSSAAWYTRVAKDPAGRFTGAALERLYLIEDARPKEAMIGFGRAAYAAWRGDGARATALTDSLYRALPHGAMWAHAAIQLSALREAGDPRAALAPLLAVADSLPSDRLAPLARQKAGDLYLSRLHDEAHAIEQYEECLARYPRAWNAPEVRRRLDQLRRDRRL